MARRLIRARRASSYQLYLLIAFVLIAVVCGVGWIWTWSLMDQHNLNTFGADRIRTAEETGQNPWRAYFYDTWGKEGPNLIDVLKSKDQLANEYRHEIQRLTQGLMGDPFDTKHGQPLRQSVSDILHSSSGLLIQSSEVLKKSYMGGAEPAADVRPPHMQAAVRALLQRIEGLVEQVRQNNQSATDLQTQITGLQEELKAAKDAHRVQVEQLQQNLEDERKRLTAARDNAVRQSERFEKQMQQRQDRHIQEKRQWETERRQLERSLLVTRSNMKDLAELVAEFRKVPPEAGVDGNIVQVGELGEVAYADIGKRDGVLLGMSFAIFGRQALGKTDAPRKADVRVVRIMDDSCELRIYQQTDEPVVVGDILHNAVYDRERHLRFMLIGRMDMDDDGVDDSERLKAMIQEFGGRVDTDLTVQTDYLILGEEPEVPPAPGADAGPMERRLYEEVRKAYIEYKKVEAAAREFSIPILSLNRFLGLVGIAGQG